MKSPLLLTGSSVDLLRFAQLRTAVRNWFYLRLLLASISFVSSFRSGNSSSSMP